MEIKETLGAIESPPDVRDYRACCIVDSKSFPVEFELPHPPIKNQGIVGSCVAHALASIVEFYNTKQEGTNVTMSTDYIYGNRLNSNHKSHGMVMRDAIQNLSKYGTCPASLMGGNHEVPEAMELFEENMIKFFADAYPNRVSTYFRIYDVETGKATLLQDIMIAAAIPWYKMYDLDKDNVVQFDFKSGKRGGHAIYIYGWNEKGWKCGNSWSSFWGKQGTFILPFDTPELEMWGIVDNNYTNPNQKQINEMQNLVLTLQTRCSELNEFIEASKLEVEALKIKANMKEDIINDLKASILNKRDEVDHLNEKIEILNKNISELETKLIEEENKRFIQDEEPENADPIPDIDKLDDREFIHIEKPFHNAFMKIVAKIINFTLRIIKKFKGE